MFHHYLRNYGILFFIRFRF